MHLDIEIDAEGPVAFFLALLENEREIYKNGNV